MENEKKHDFKIQFNSLNVCPDDPTILKGKVIIHDFEPSWNNQCITEEVCAENMKTLIGKRISCKYIPCENNNGVDALKGHENRIGKDRDGNDIAVTDTIAIGFIENVYIDDYTDENGIAKRVLFADVVIWNDDKYSNIAGLLKEWLDRGVKIHMSVEYLYMNYNVVNGVEYIQSPIIYSAHVLLNSENRENIKEVLPAYDVATLLSFNDREKWNKAVNEILNKSKNKKEDEGMAKENVFFKSLCELSLGDMKESIMTELSKTMTADEFYYVWVSNYAIYDTYFVYETYENEKWVNYKVTYTKENDKIVLDLANKVQVERESIWVEVSSYNVLQTSLNEKVEEIKSLNEQLQTAKNNSAETLNKFNDLTDTVTSLNAKVEEMKPIVDEYNKEQFEKSLNEVKDYYKEKFEAVNAIDEFETEEVQELIKKSVNEKDELELTKIKFSLNQKITDKLVKKEENKPNEVADSKISLNQIIKGTENKNLNPTDSEFENMFGFSIDN